MTFTELVDLVAYLKSLGGDGHHHDAAARSRERTAGPYRVRVEYQAAGGAGGHEHPGHGGAQAARTGHLMVFVADAATGEVVPYLPVSAVVAAGGAAPRTVRLVPMLGDTGFHYGADVTLPENDEAHADARRGRSHDDGHGDRSLRQAGDGELRLE